MRRYKCQFCSFTVAVNNTSDKKNIQSTKRKMGAHYETVHKTLIPPDLTGYRWFYFLLTGKKRGTCVECGGETDFNEVTMKYCRFCNNPACKQKYKERRDKNQMGAHGKLYMTDDPEFQKIMLAARKISGTYLWSDKTTRIGYTGSYELHFLQYLDSIGWKASDIIGPSPHSYVYQYEGKDHWYIPDFFIPSLSLEIEIKDDGSAKNINQESREKDKLKEELMKSNCNYFNYIKIINKNYDGFRELIKGE